MKLAAIDEAEIPRAKIVLYLLNPNHHAGKSKARFFSRHGFTANGWQQLADALRQHARENEVVRQGQTPLGERFVVEGPIAMADGTVARVRSVWFVESGEQTPRFVTAYPLQQRRKT
jgi:hypothetical protein